VAAPPFPPPGLGIRCSAAAITPLVVCKSRQCPTNVISNRLLGVHSDENGYRGRRSRVAQGHGHCLANLRVGARKNGLQGLHGIFSSELADAQNRKHTNPVVKSAAAAGKKTGEERKLFGCSDSGQLLGDYTAQAQVGALIE